MDSGEVQALEIDMYNNAGYSLDLSASVIERALFHMDNVQSLFWFRTNLCNRCTTFPTSEGQAMSARPICLPTPHFVVSVVRRFVAFVMNLMFMSWQGNGFC